MINPAQEPIAVDRARSLHGMVVSPHTPASKAGHQVLQQGGNAVDAAIAVCAALSVTYPHMNGLGGDGLWLIYDASTQQVHGLNGSGRSATYLDANTLLNGAELPQRGAVAAMTVPGAVDAWWQAHQRFGHIPWASLLQPAIALAETGYALSSSQFRWTRKDRDLLAQDIGAAATFLSAAQVGDSIQNPALAQVLKTLAVDGAEFFYRGAIAQTIIDYVAPLGSPLRLEDFAQHRSNWVEPLTTEYRGHTIYQLPPNTQGLTVLQILNLIEPDDIASLTQVDYYHLIVEAIKLAFCDRDRWAGDPTFTDIPIELLISKAYAAQLRPQIDWQQARFQQGPAMGGDTIYAAVVDHQGNAVSLLQSLYFDYGCGVVPPDLGFALNNRGTIFSTVAGHVNRVAPGKRPLQTLIPAIALAHGQPQLVFGTMGGEGQPQTQVALLTRVLDLGLDIQTAINLPRWRWGRTWGQSSARLALEGRISPEIRHGLRQRGHQLQIEADWSEAMGHAHMIQVRDDWLLGACDPRSDGIAVGL
ncbi:gamma-glutamyltransferase [Leptolyngbya sp. Heron Island J]|uniref:gamma-glutamyltransferase n=1 Tax=Leptolyngbya sp. Heron Island J TaxID=1385935 RepID=UPI0003B97D22|nr:gamma-glutamyltransferase [Leptolyngbya sp. Heron Island J]ESA32581.1 gamma-glutamyltransferase [Leptolyngbya sp. Heron Island J]